LKHGLGQDLRNVVRRHADITGHLGAEDNQWASFAEAMAATGPDVDLRFEVLLGDEPPELTHDLCCSTGLTACASTDRDAGFFRVSRSLERSAEVLKFKGVREAVRHEGHRHFFRMGSILWGLTRP